MAVRSGDTETAQKMVEAAAEKAGYTIHAYHGTARADRVGTEFREDSATSGPMAFFTDSKEIASNYASRAQAVVGHQHHMVDLRHFLRHRQCAAIAYAAAVEHHHQFRMPLSEFKVFHGRPPCRSASRAAPTTAASRSPQGSGRILPFPRCRTAISFAFLLSLCTASDPLFPESPTPWCVRPNSHRCQAGR